MAAGTIPDIPASTNTPQTNPVYPAGYNPNSPQVCSATYQCRIPGDIWDSPNGTFASAFDDGPTAVSPWNLPIVLFLRSLIQATPTIVQFLESNNLSTTHFMIGINILANPSQFSAAFDAGHDIAVHTWTHPYMTTLSNLDILGQVSRM